MMRASLKATTRRSRTAQTSSSRTLHSMAPRKIRLKQNIRKQTAIKAFNNSPTARAGLRGLLNSHSNVASMHSATGATRSFSTALQKTIQKELQQLEIFFSKVPKGFEKFTKKAATNNTKGNVNSGAKRAKSTGSGKGKKPGTGPKKAKPSPPKGDGSKPPLQDLLTLGIGASLLYALTSGGSDSRGVEIDWQTFKTQLLATGEVERIVVVNKQTAKIVVRSDINVMRSSNGSNSGSSDMSRSTNGYSEPDVRDPYMMDAGRGDPAASGDKYASAGSNGYSGPTIGKRPPTSNRSNYYFTIGSIESFERKLEITQRELGISTSEFVPVQYASETNWGSELLKFAPTLLIIGAYFYLMKGGGQGMMGGGGGGAGGKMKDMFNIGKSNAKKQMGDNKSKTTFKDVAGVDEAKVEVMEFVQFLKDPTKFEKLGAKIPKGALLVGPPGTGKTLLAKAVAGEAAVPFFSISGSDFIEMFVGVGASRVRDLFKEAREAAPCIVFIDEIDAVARARGKGGMGGGNDERENTLNQLLVEMDGFDSTEGVVVLAGTNRADILDPAILRPGRFDRQISVDKPDIKGRRDIFCVHLNGMQLDPLAPIVTTFMEQGMDFETATLKAEAEAAEAIEAKENMNEEDIVADNMTEEDSVDDSATTENHNENEIEDVLRTATEAEEKNEKFETERIEQDLKFPTNQEQAQELVNALFEEEEDEVEDVVVAIETDRELINFFAERMAALTPGFAGAEIANICNEAAIIAARTDQEVVGLASFEKAADRVIGGIEKPNKIMTPLEKRTVAYHEAGHAIVGWFSENASPLLKVTIVPRTSGALGFAQYLPKELNLHTKEQIMDMMCMTLGGRAAEELTFGKVTTGASDDLNKVTQMAYSMVRIYGMCERIGNVSFPPSEGQMEFDKPYSDNLAQIMDEEAKKIIDEAYERTKAMLIERSDELIGVAEKLLEKETINQDDVIAIIGERPFDSADNYQDILRQAWKRDDDINAEKAAQEKKDENIEIGGAAVASKGL